MVWQKRSNVEMEKFQIALNVFQICFDIFVIVYILKRWKKRDAE